MPNGPYTPADAAHEKSVRAFMSSLSPGRRRRIEAKYPVLSADQLRQIRDSETLWDPCLLDLVETSGLPVHRSALKTFPELRGGLYEAPRGA